MKIPLSPKNPSRTFVFPAISCLILLAFSCTKKDTYPVYRLIDHLGQENILRSPFQEFAADHEKFKERNPGLYDIADESPLLDLGVGENPFLIKKKLKLGLAEINTLLSPSQSHVRVPVKIPERPDFISPMGSEEIPNWIKREKESE